ncbi:MAG: DNA polymerase/3'-5' exonuclease PolX [Planctomycetes bacterium]|nr:DNA polymerase/3'-5' exonuclease PolX [Planctomycetota bacterium]
MNNTQIADVINRVADLLEIKGTNPFRLRAYRNVVRTLRDLPESAEAILADPQRDLTDIKGIGKDLAEKIATIAATGTLPLLEELLQEIPESVLSILRIPGLGPKKAAVLYNDLKITTLDQLQAACEAHQVAELKGFGEKTEQTILAGIPLAARAEQRIYWAKADEIAQVLLEHLRNCKSLQQIEVAGSYRRGRETIGDLDLLVVSDDHDEVMDRLADFDAVEQTIGRGDTKMSIRLAGGLQVDLRVVPAESFGAALQYFTGSKDHNVILRGMAKSRGLKINEWGVFRVAEGKDGANGGDNEYIAGRTEEEVYAAIDLPYFPPEIREARQEFEWAELGMLPELIELGDIRGDLHMHTTASDGRASTLEMIAAARQRGLTYIAITDHSKRVSMANGLDGERLLEQWAEIDEINAGLKNFTVLKGVEVDILEKGGLDIADDVLARADWIVASVHYGQRQSSEQITGRIVEAIRNPHVSAIAHPTGRIINRRERYEVDLEAVMRAAVEHGKLLELNANPARLDLDDVHCAAAKRHAIPVVINTDAHSIAGLDVMRHGIQQARRAGLTKADVANTRSWKQMRKLIGR